MIITAHLPLTSISQASLLFSPRPTAMIDAGPGTAIWREERRGRSLLQDTGLTHRDGHVPKAVPARKGFAAH